MEQSTEQTSTVTAQDVIEHSQQQQGEERPQSAVTQSSTKESSAGFHIDDKLAALAKKEREFFLKEKRMKELEAKLKRYEDLEQLKDQDPFEYLRAAGVDLEKTLAKYAEVGGKSVDEKVVELEKRYQELERMIREKEEQARRLQEQTAIETFRANLVKEVQGNQARWELVNNQEAYDLVFEVIERHFQVTKEQTGEGEVLPVEKAADMVEKYFEDRVKKVIGTKKLQSFLPAKKEEPQPLSKNTTLSNSLSGNIPQASGSGALLPRDQALKEIAKRFKPQ